MGFFLQLPQSVVSEAARPYGRAEDPLNRGEGNSRREVVTPTVSSLKGNFVTVKLKFFQITYHKGNEIALYQQASRLVTQTQTCQEYS